MTTGPEPVVDLDRVLTVLNRHGVEYLVVGGAAANLHGATRVTLDFDCLPETSLENLDRLAAAMRELNARLRVAGLSDDEAKELPNPLDAQTLRQLEISTWRTDAGDFDVLAEIPNRQGDHLRYDQLAPRALSIDVTGKPVRVAALDDVISSKEWANRAKDQAALPELRAIRDAQTQRHDPQLGL